MLWTLGMGTLVWCVVALALGSFVGHVIALGMDDDAPEHVAVHMSNGAIVLNTVMGGSTVPLKFNLTSGTPEEDECERRQDL